ncbi:Ubiquitin--protein ligase [Bertholletia excelsa]
MDMDSGFSESMPPSYSEETSTPSGDFECNICFELAEDPIVTLCGHLYCWPCLYKWLHLHSYSHECPVCKALIVEDKLVPIYGRGKTSLDPRNRPIPEFDVPNRPAAQRPETAPPPSPGLNYMHQESNGPYGGFTPMARERNFQPSTGLGGWIRFLTFQMHGFNFTNAHGATVGLPHGIPGSTRGAHAFGLHQHLNRGHHSDSVLKKCFLCAGLAVILYLIL